MSSIEPRILQQPSLHRLQPIQGNSHSPVTFGAVSRDRFTPTFSGGTQQPNFLQRFWMWVKSLPQAIKTFWQKLLGTQTSKPVTSTTPVKPASSSADGSAALYSHIDPKLVSDPYERQCISMQLADTTFDQIVQNYQERPVKKGKDGIYYSWDSLNGQLLTKQAQKLLNTNTEAKVKFLMRELGHLGEYTPPDKHVNGLNSSRDSLGTVEVLHPTGLKYDLSIPSHRQRAYATYVHELEHMVRSYAYNIAGDGGAHVTEPTPTDPVKHLYLNVTTGAVSGGNGYYLQSQLATANPHLPNIDLYSDKSLTQLDSAAVQRYWKPLARFWARTDFPVLTERGGDRLKQEVDDLLEQGDPKLIKEWMNQYVVDELESYMTAFKRAPGLPKDRLQPGDFKEFGSAMYLRDLLRYYYQHPRHRIPPSEQHPMAQVIPLEQIWKQQNGVEPLQG